MAPYWLQVREALISWLNYMTRPRDLGFSSIRFDFVRGYEEYIKEYVDSTVYPRGELSVAEWWNDDDGRNPVSRLSLTPVSPSCPAR
jgi:hypothetical protein